MNEESSLSVLTSNQNGLKATTTTGSVAASTGGAAAEPSVSSPATGSTSAKNNPGTDSSALDFISTGNAVKALFSIPYSGINVDKGQNTSPTKPLCLAVHNFDGTLIIDHAEDEQNYFGRQAAQSNATKPSSWITPDKDENATKLLPSVAAEPLALVLNSTFNSSNEDATDTHAKQHESSEALSLLSDIVQSKDNGNATDSPTSASSEILNAPREFLEWKFQDMNLLVGSDALIVRPPGPAPSTSAANASPAGIAVRVEEVNRLRKSYQAFHQKQQALLSGKEETEKSSSAQSPKQPEQRTYAQALLQHPKKDTKQTSSDEQDGDKIGLPEIPLQTCIVPFSGPWGGRIVLDSSNYVSESPGCSTSTDNVTPAISIVLDAYLDNLMTNVPQLALCLQEKGLIQSVKLLQTEEIPSMMMHPSTLDTKYPVDTIHRPSKSASESFGQQHDLFSPQVMEMNASALLRFLKANCTRNHATYLLRHDPIIQRDIDPQQQNIQLYDISSISTQGQKKWIWWLATMSHRFALRLRQLEISTSSTTMYMSETQKRANRDRQRSLCQQTLDLLQDLSDMDGNTHESMVASVREHMADTYLGVTDSGYETDLGADSSASTTKRKKSPPTVPMVASSTMPDAPSSSMAASSVGALPSIKKTTQLKIISGPNSDTTRQHTHRLSQLSQHKQPYAHVSVDALNKAQDHLYHGIKTLAILLESDLGDQKPMEIANEQRQAEPAHRRRRKRPTKNETKSNNEEEKKEEEYQFSPAMAMQLFGMNYKYVNVSLRLAEHHLNNYYSSSAMQSLRTAARHLADAVKLLEYYNKASGNANNSQGRFQEEERLLQLQYVWLLEHCGHFARSFASDELWRDRGHASGDDVIFVLKGVEGSFVKDEVGKKRKQNCIKNHFWDIVNADALIKKSKGRISLQSLSAIGFPSSVDSSKVNDAINAAEVILSKEILLHRERRRVLVASCISYNRAIAAFRDAMIDPFATTTPEEGCNNLQLMIQTTALHLLLQRYGDACNETGKTLLTALRNLLAITQGGKNNNKSQLAADTMLDSAQFWFNEGSHAFEECRDARNLALVRCNVCQAYKLKANAGFAKVGNEASKHADDCLQQAANHLQKAHEDLGERDADPQTWDMVSEELAATFLVLGVRRRQNLLGGSSSSIIFQVKRLSPGEERSILEPMERALEVYDQSGNAYQAAASHYQLALTLSKMWTCQVNENNTRKKLTSAFEHYGAAFGYFSTHVRGNESTFCVLCLDLASLYSAMSGEEGLLKAFQCCLDSREAFAAETIKQAAGNSHSSVIDEWFDKMETVATSIDERLFKLLRSLVKLNQDRYKDLYREALTAKMVRNVPEDDECESHPKAAKLLALHEMLVVIKKKYDSLLNSR